MDNNQQNQFNLGMLYNPMMLGMQSPLGMGFLGGMYGQGFFLPQEAVNPWIYQPSFAESTYKYLTGLNLPLGVGEVELYGASSQDFYDSLAAGFLGFSKFAVSTAVGDILTSRMIPAPVPPPDAGPIRRFLANPLLTPKGFLLNAGLFLLADKALSTFITDPFKRSIQMGETYRQALMTVSPFSDNYDVFRGGLKRSVLQELELSTSQIAAEHPYLDQGDMSALIIGAGISGILDVTKGDTRQLKEAIKSLADGVKFYAQLAKDPTIIDSMKELASLSQMGVNINELITVGTQLALGAKRAGYVYSQLSPYVNQYAQQFMGTGISPVHAAQGFVEALNVAKSTELALRAEGNPMLGAFGGLEGIQQQIAMMPQGLAQSNLGMLSMYSTLLNKGNITSMLPNMSPNEYLNMMAFKNTYTSLAMQRPEVVGADALIQSINLTRQITGGETPLWLVKNIAQQFGLSDVQTDLLLEQSRMRNAILDNDLTSYGNIYTQQTLELISEANPSIFRRIGTGVASIWNTLKNPGRYAAIAWQHAVENLQRGYINADESGIFFRMTLPIVSSVFPEIGRKAALIEYDLSSDISRQELLEKVEPLAKYISGEDVGLSPIAFSQVSVESNIAPLHKAIERKMAKINSALDKAKPLIGSVNLADLTPEQRLALVKTLNKIKKGEPVSGEDLDKIGSALPVTSELKAHLHPIKDSPGMYALNYGDRTEFFSELYLGEITDNVVEDVEELNMLEEDLSLATAKRNIGVSARSLMLRLLKDKEFIKKYGENPEELAKIRSELLHKKDLTIDEIKYYRLRINDNLNIRKLNEDKYIKHQQELMFVAGTSDESTAVLKAAASQRILVREDKEQLMTRAEFERTKLMEGQLERQYSNILERDSRINRIYNLLDEDSKVRLKLQAEIMKDSLVTAFDDALAKFAQGDALRVTIVDKGEIHGYMYKSVNNEYVYNGPRKSPD